MSINSSLTHYIQTSEQHILVTGLSRSGKSTLLTSLMAQLSTRAEHPIDHLPLLFALPPERLVRVVLTQVKDNQRFPYEENLSALQQQQWPSPTTKISQFVLDIEMQRPNTWLQRLLGNARTRIIIHDYPGEWLMDLPMAEQAFVDWSAHVFAQQATEPQLTLAKAWLDCVQNFDFSLPANDLYVGQLVDAYKDYLVKAKADGISRLQPGALLLPPDIPTDWVTFCPLPSKITVNPDHPWVKLFTYRYTALVDNWIKPLQRQYFRHAEKQVILLDLLEGLNYGKDYLSEMQEALNHLMQSFVYGQRKWYQWFQQPMGIRQVHFVASKADMIPLSQHPALLSLLRDVTAGAAQQLTQHQVHYQHHLLAAMVATKPDTDEQALLYKHPDGQTHRATFTPIPHHLSQWQANAIYPCLKVQPPSIRDVTDIQSMYLDHLLHRLLLDEAKP